MPQAPPPTPRVPLTGLAQGATARLLDVDTDAESRDILRALGLTAGSPLRVCQQGEPCIIQVRETRIGLSSRVAGQVVVAPDQAPPGRGEGR